MHIKQIRVMTLMLAGQSVLVSLLNQRQDLALNLFVVEIIFFPLLILSALGSRSNSPLSIQSIFGYIFLLSTISNLSFFTPEIHHPFQHWLRLLFPLATLVIAVRVFQKDEKEIEVFTIAFVATLIFTCYKTFDVSAIIALEQGIKHQTNWGNAVAASSPFIFLIKRRYLRNIFLFLTIVTLIASLKRTAFLSAAILIIVYFWQFIKYLKVNIRFSIKSLFVFLTGFAVFAFGAYYIIANQNFDSYLMRAQARILSSSNDGGSGRLGIWSSAIKIFNENSLFETFFGRGFGWYHDNYRILGYDVESLHNDAIDFLISFGVLGLLLYLLFVARIIRLAFYFRNSESDASFAVSTALIFLIYSAFAGTFYYVFFFTPLFIAIGYLEGRKLGSRPLNRLDAVRAV